MTLEKTQALAEKHIEAHLTGWKFAWHNKKRVLGTCSHNTKTILLSKTFANGLGEKEILDTILHEIAHALVGSGNGHNAVWKAQARKLGISDSACAKDLDISLEDLGAKWVMVDEEGNIYKHWFRKPRKSTFDKLPFTYFVDAKEQTLGKLSIIPYGV